MVLRYFIFQESFFLGNMISVPVRCLLRYFLISMGFTASDERSSIVRDAVPLICIFQCVVPVKTYFT